MEVFFIVCYFLLFVIQIYRECILAVVVSVVVLCCLFLVSVSVTFHLMFVNTILVRFGFLSGHLLGKSCSLG